MNHTALSAMVLLSIVSLSATNSHADLILNAPQRVTESPGEFQIAYRVENRTNVVLFGNLAGVEQVSGSSEYVHLINKIYVFPDVNPGALSDRFTLTWQADNIQVETNASVILIYFQIPTVPAMATTQVSIAVPEPSSLVLAGAAAAALLLGYGALRLWTGLQPSIGRPVE